jgi:hypothetical protein
LPADRTWKPQSTCSSRALARECALGSYATKGERERPLSKHVGEMDEYGYDLDPPNVAPL